MSHSFAPDLLMSTKPEASTDRIIMLSAHPEEADISRALQDLRVALGGCDVAQDVLGRVEISLAEVLNNITEHGFSHHPKTPIQVTTSISEGSIQTEIRDKGAPVPGHVLKNTSLPDNTGSLNTLPEGGFGWYLIHKLSDRLSYHRNEDENRWELVFVTS